MQPPQLKTLEYIESPEQRRALSQTTRMAEGLPGLLMSSPLCLGPSHLVFFTLVNSCPAFPDFTTPGSFLQELC